MLAVIGDDELPGEAGLQDDIESSMDRHEWLNDTVDFFVDMSVAPVALVTVLVAYHFVRRELAARTALLVPAAAAAGIAARVVKEVLGGHLPSGHAAYVVATFGLLTALALDRGRRDVAAVTAGFMVVVPPCLFAQGTHTAIAILAGIALGLAWLVAVLFASTLLRARA